MARVRDRSRETYKTMAERDRDGDEVYLVEPLDYIILESLPEEGANVGGVIPLGETVRNLVSTKFKEVGVDAAMLGGRFTSLSALGYVKRIKIPRSDAAGWQITARGQEVLDAWKATQTNHKEGS